MTIRALGVAVLLALSLVSCGEDDAVASDAIADSIIRNNQDYGLTRAEADCVGDGFVDRIGVEKLRDDGVLTGDLESERGLDQVRMSPEDASVAADVMGECADLKGLFTSALPDLPTASRQCVDRELTDEVLHDYVASVLAARPDEGRRALESSLEECVRLGG